MLPAFSAIRIAEDGHSHRAADLASEVGEIAVDILSVPVIDAHDRATVEMLGGSNRRQRLRVSSAGERQQAENEKSVNQVTHRRSFNAV
jgi:hypothetical protein